MATYATQADVADYIEGFVIENPAALEDLLEKAETDIDDAIGIYTREAGSLLKLDPTLLDDTKVLFLRRATCAQVEYRLSMGEEFFVHGVRQEVEGRNVKVTKPARLGPKARQELVRGGLFRLSGRSRGPWLPNQNVDDFIP